MADGSSSPDQKESTPVVNYPIPRTGRVVEAARKSQPLIKNNVIKGNRSGGRIIE